MTGRAMPRCSSAWRQSPRTNGTLRPSLYAGNDFAYGGAEADPSESGFSGVAASAIALPSQLAQFDLALDGSSDGLYTLSIGTDDVVTITGTAGLSLADMAGRIANSSGC